MVDHVEYCTTFYIRTSNIHGIPVHKILSPYTTGFSATGSWYQVPSVVDEVLHQIYYQLYFILINCQSNLIVVQLAVSKEPH